jgi:hypothetical protein
VHYDHSSQCANDSISFIAAIRGLSRIFVSVFHSFNQSQDDYQYLDQYRRHTMACPAPRLGWAYERRSVPDDTASTTQTLVSTGVGSEAVHYPRKARSPMTVLSRCVYHPYLENLFHGQRNYAQLIRVSTLQIIRFPSSQHHESISSHSRIVLWATQTDGIHIQFPRHIYKSPQGI